MALRFTRAEFIWRGHLPFLPWADGLVAGGDRPAHTTTPFVEIDNLVPARADMTALRAVRVIHYDAALPVDAVLTS